jgi:hypothetical protein
MELIYDDYNINELIDSIKNESKCTRADTLNSVSKYIKIEPIARDIKHQGDKSGTVIDQYLLYMILKLGERVCELEQHDASNEPVVMEQQNKVEYELVGESETITVNGRKIYTRLGFDTAIELDLDRIEDIDEILRILEKFRSTQPKQIRISAPQKP